jgi:DDE superfamily endonuclease
VDEKEDYFALPQPVDCRDKPGVVPGSVWSFCPQAKGSHQGDYHKVFNSTNFVAWFVDQLLPNLSHPSLIVMDNASYHCTYPPEVPTVGTSKKADLVDYLIRKGVPIDPTDTVPILRSKAKKYIIEQEKKLCEQLALDAGHEVCYQPPHHSDFQPIELLWAKLKGNIGRKYNSDTTMAILKERLDEEFEAALTWNDSIGGMIRKTSAICRSFYKSDEDDNDAGNGDGEDPNSEDPIVDDDSSQISSESEGSE